MSSRSEYCIVNELDDILENIGAENRTFSDKLAELTKLVDTDNDEISDLLSDLENCSANIDNELEDFDSLLAGADDFAREHLDSAREEGYDDGQDTGYQEAGIEIAENYEKLIWAKFDSWFGLESENFDPVKYAEMTIELRGDLSKC